MHKIYLEKRCMVICSPEEQALGDPNSIELHLGDSPNFAALVSMFQTSGSLSRIYIPTPCEEKTYKSFCSQFKEVNAAGGLVSNRRGDVLLISRNGMWDLPKGHQEEGEDIRTTALREVQEETGVGQLELGELICVTDHCYLRGGTWHLKHTWWYDPAEGGGHHQGRMGRPLQPVPIPEEHLPVDNGSVQGGAHLTEFQCLKHFRNFFRIVKVSV